MGCWNETCMISQLPILCGQDVAMVLLQRQTKGLSSDGSCYSDTYFKPYPIVLYGKYDDYGAIEEITGDVKLFYEIVHNQLRCTEEDVISSYKKWYTHYSEDEKSTAYIRYLQDSHRTSEHSNEDVGFAMIHRELFDKLKSTRDDFWSKTKEDIVKKYVDNFTYAYKIEEMKKQNVDKDIIMEFILAHGINNYNRNFAEIDLSDVNDQSISDLLGIMYAFNSLRKLWFPQTGCGSQASIEQPNEILAEFYSNTIKKYKEDAEEDE